PADVPEPELADDFADRLEVVLRDRVFEAGAARTPARADEASRVDVDDGERLGVVEDEIPAGGKVDAPVERGAHGLVHTVQLHERLLALVELDARRELGRSPLEVADDAPVRAVVVDDHALEVADEEVADDPERQLRLLVDERRSLGALGAPLDRRPELLQESEVAFELFLRGALGRRADDEPAVGKLETLADDLEPLALLILQAPRDADAVPVRDEDEEPAGKRDLGRQPGALRSHGILDRLDEHLLAALDQLLDAAPVARLPFELRDDDLVHVEEPVLLEPDLDEGRLHAREDVVDDALVDVARHGAVRGAAEVDLDDDAVLEHRDPLLGHLDRDEDLLLDLRKGRALRRLRAP